MHAAGIGGECADEGAARQFYEDAGLDKDGVDKDAFVDFMRMMSETTGESVEKISKSFTAALATKSNKYDIRDVLDEPIDDVEDDNEDAENADGQACECGNIFKEDSIFCRKCGKPRPGLACVNCGTPFAEDDVKFCRECGERRPEAATKTRERRRKTSMIRRATTGLRSSARGGSRGTEEVHVLDRGSSKFSIGALKGLFSFSSTKEVDYDLGYPDDDKWPKLDLRGLGPRPAVKLKPERRLRDELLAALRGRHNMFALDRPDGEDDQVMDIAPTLPEKDPRHRFFAREHAFGHSEDEKTRQLERAAWMVLEDVQSRVKREVYMKNAYMKLAGYLVSMFCLFSVIMLQWGFGSANRRLHSVLSDQLFTANYGYREYRVNSEQVQDYGYSAVDITDWITSNVLENIFVPNVCGNAEWCVPHPHLFCFARFLMFDIVVPFSVYAFPASTRTSIHIFGVRRRCANSRVANPIAGRQSRSE